MKEGRKDWRKAREKEAERRSERRGQRQKASSQCAHIRVGVPAGLQQGDDGFGEGDADGGTRVVVSRLCRCSRCGHIMHIVI